MGSAFFFERTRLRKENLIHKPREKLQAAKESKMRFEDMNWMQVEEYLKRDDRVILVLGACEQHGYLSLLTDIRIPLALAEAASEETGVVVAPPLNFGVSPYFLAYPGTISLRLSTFIQVVEDMVRSLYGQGFRRFLVLNGHGGNDSARARLTELSNELDGLTAAWYAWWTTPTVARFAEARGLLPEHASWMEAFSFTRVAPLPEGEKAPAPPTARLLNAVQTRQRNGDGMFGGVYQTDLKWMDELFGLCLADVLPLLAFQP